MAVIRMLKGIGHVLETYGLGLKGPGLGRLGFGQKILALTASLFITTRMYWLE